MCHRVFIKSLQGVTKLGTFEHTVVSQLQKWKTN
uniref:Uncharacterized protein n=1 Tax=Anguilla anguilla TaxID=7936 RepID=A0A0E9V2R7_ANGAN